MDLETSCLALQGPYFQPFFSYGKLVNLITKLVGWLVWLESAYIPAEDDEITYGSSFQCEGTACLQF